jgi:hypothetical protein
MNELLNKLFEYSTSNHVFVGDCRTILDDEVACRAIGAYDATELAQIVEEGTNITKDEFLSVCSVDKEILEKLNKKPKRFSFFHNEDVYWYYDDVKDIEYFYAS